MKKLNKVNEEVALSKVTKEQYDNHDILKPFDPEDKGHNISGTYSTIGRDPIDTLRIKIQLIEDVIEANRNAYPNLKEELDVHKSVLEDIMEKVE